MIDGLFVFLDRRGKRLAQTQKKFFLRVIHVSLPLFKSYPCVIGVRNGVLKGQQHQRKNWGGGGAQDFGAHGVSWFRRCHLDLKCAELVKR